MTRADVVKVSIDDLAYLAPDRSPTAAAQAFLDRGATVVLVTDGPGPVLIVTATGVAQLADPGGLDRRYRRRRRRLRWRFPRPLDRARFRA